MIPNAEVIKQLMKDYLGSIQISIPEEGMKIKLDEKEVAEYSEGVFKAIEAEVQGLCDSTYRAGYAKATRPEWLAPLIRPAEGDDDDPRHPKRG